LFVVDDGPGTVEIQARLVASVDVLVASARVQRSHLRVATTSTSVTSSACEPGAAASICEGVYPELTVPSDAPACYLLLDDSDTPCGDGWVELILIPQDTGRSGVFLVSPNLSAPDVEIPGCEYET